MSASHTASCTEQRALWRDGTTTFRRSAESIRSHDNRVDAMAKTLREVQRDCPGCRLARARGRRNQNQKPATKPMSANDWRASRPTPKGTPMSKPREHCQTGAGCLRPNGHKPPHRFAPDRPVAGNLTLVGAAYVAGAEDMRERAATLVNNARDSWTYEDLASRILGLPISPPPRPGG